MAAAPVAAAVSEWPLSDLLWHHQQVRDTETNNMGTTSTTYICYYLYHDTPI